MDLIVYQMLSERRSDFKLDIMMGLIYGNMMQRIGIWLCVRILLRLIINLFMIRLWDSMESIYEFNVIKFIRCCPSDALILILDIMMVLPYVNMIQRIGIWLWVRILIRSNHKFIYDPIMWFDGIDL